MNKLHPHLLLHVLLSRECLLCNDGEGGSVAHFSFFLLFFATFVDTDIYTYYSHRLRPVIGAE